MQIIIIMILLYICMYVERMIYHVIQRYVYIDIAYKIKILRIITSQRPTVSIVINAYCRLS